MPQLRLHISAAVAVGALMLLTASPASPASADTPPPPGPASLPALTVPGKPTLDSTDSRGTNVEIMGGEDRTLLGMPGSRLGNSPYRISQVGPTSGVRTTSGSGGVGIGSTNHAGGLEDPHGNPAPAAVPGNEGTYVETPPAPGAS
jgi:hypothetical protein